LVLASTTSTRDSGLFEVLLPPFERANGVKVKVIAVGTGQALALGRRGDCDVLLVHAPELEQRFMRAGYGYLRREVMHNDFILLGPPTDPAHVRGERSVVKAFAKLARAKATFVSRGDHSGTHFKERAIWSRAGRSPEGNWYLETGQGMAATLRIADEKRAYVLCDRATYLAHRAKLRLIIVLEGDKLLYNPYSVIVVNPVKFPRVNLKHALAFLRFLTSKEGRELIGQFGVKQFGRPLFAPIACK